MQPVLPHGLSERLDLLESSYRRASAAERWHDELYDRAPVGFILYSPPPGNLILWANRCMQGLFFGVAESDLLVAPAEAIGKRYSDVFDAELSAYISARNDEVVETGYPQEEYWSDVARCGVAWSCKRWLTDSGNIAVVLVPVNADMLARCWAAACA